VDARGLDLADVDLGDVTEADLGQAGAAVFALDGAGARGPAPSPLGPALFRVNAILAPRDVSFEEAREDLLPEVQMDRARRVIQDMVDDLDDRLAGGATIEDLVEETELEIGRIDLEPGTSEGIAAYDSFRAAAAAAEPGDFPEIVEIPEGGVFALRLDELRAPALRPFERCGTRSRRLARGRDRAADGGRGRDPCRRTAGGGRHRGPRPAVGTEWGLVRDAFVDGAPPGLVPALFEMAEGEVRVVTDETGAWIVRLDRISPADPGSAEARRAEGAPDRAGGAGGGGRPSRRLHRRRLRRRRGSRSTRPRSTRCTRSSPDGALPGFRRIRSGLRGGAQPDRLDAARRRPRHRRCR
jgi:peptidyl-prolyl cis-trans isomerase D